MKLWHFTRRVAPALIVVFGAGVISKVLSLLGSVVVNRWGELQGISEFYLVFNYAQSLAFYCHLGAAITVMAALVRRKDRTPLDDDFAIRVFFAVQTRALPVVAGIVVLLLGMGGFRLAQMPTMLAAVVAAYGMGYNQVKCAVLLARRDDRGMAWYTLTVTLCAYAPVLAAVATGHSSFAGAALAFGFGVPVVIDLIRCGSLRARSAGEFTDFIAGGKYVLWGNSLYAIAALLVVHRVEQQFAPAAIVAFGIVNQLRALLLFVPAQVGPLIVRSVAGRDSAGDGRRFGLMSATALGATVAISVALVVPLLLEPRIIERVFSGRATIDPAVTMGLWASALAAAVGVSCRILEGRQRYRDIFVSNIAFAGLYVAVVFAAPGNHYWVQTGLAIALLAQLVMLVVSIVIARTRGVGAPLRSERSAVTGEEVALARV